MVQNSAECVSRLRAFIVCYKLLVGLSEVTDVLFQELINIFVGKL